MEPWDDDFYCEPSEFERQIEEFRQSLMNSVKDEYKAEMERLRTENAELQQVKNRMKDIERERSHEKNDVERAKRDALKEAKQLRLSELLRDYKHVIYRADYNHEYLEKCGNCDEKRKVRYITPLGREEKEECTCAKHIKRYFIREVHASRIEHYSAAGDISVTYYDDIDEERIIRSTIHKAGTDVKKAKEWFCFEEKEDCEKFIDWMNAQEAAKESK
ncbi:hypothetical protein BBD42_12995 [Paenibacillus sp. BIHB 4019]|uniref:Uncharacterized protein n=1 Tax=Paenibacillus sp. BIHB 4019 TaxID=1870819 RepID=A0A1B2DHT3_9BACL|nr:hypothetical protein [Paenibacillus sp. BIHB 4019]ANY67287.1 hypothetical protein BBD42_12995 [Paenibacillus sp. BIHB 4019]